MKKLALLFGFVFLIFLSKAYAFEVKLEPENVFCLSGKCD